MKYLVVCIVFSLFFFELGFAQKKDLIQPRQDREELVFYTWREQDIPLWQAINERNLIEGVKVKAVWIQADQYDSKTRIDIQNGQVDLFLGRAGAGWLEDWIRSTIIKPLNYDDKRWQLLAPASLDSVRGSDGRFYGVPYLMQAQALLLNMDVLNRYGIVPNWKTLEELEQDFQILRSEGINPLHIAGRAAWYLGQVLIETMAAGMLQRKDVLALVDGKACFNDKPFTSIFRLLKKWQVLGYINPYPVNDNYQDMRIAFALGESAMMIDGLWSFSKLSAVHIIDPDLDMQFVAFPGGTGAIYTFGDASILANAYSEKQQAIAKVFDFAFTQTFAQMIIEFLNGEIPTYGNLEDLKLKEGSLLADHRYLFAKGNKDATPYFSYQLNRGRPSYAELSSANAQLLLVGQARVKQATANIQQGLNSWGYNGAKNCTFED